MKLTRAFQELASFYSKHVEVITPGGHVDELINCWIEEIEAEDNGFNDPNDYYVNVLDGVHYKTERGGDGGLAYKIAK